MVRGGGGVRRDLQLWPSVLLLPCLACGGDGSGTETGPEWLTELEHRFTGTAEQGVRIPDVIYTFHYVMCS